jgi:hypothetical protein
MSTPVCVISEHDFVASIADALQYIAVYHPPSFVRALAESYRAEESPAARDAIAQILINSKMAAYGVRSANLSTTRCGWLTPIRTTPSAPRSSAIRYLTAPIRATTHPRWFTST